MVVGNMNCRMTQRKFTKEYDNLIEEIADVQVMLLQMAYLLKTDIQSMVDIKLNRQLERIKRE